MHSLFAVLAAGFGLALVAPPAAPTDNAVTALTCLDNPSFQEVQPLDFSKIVSAGALSSRGGQKIEVYLSNGSFTVAQMANEYVLPLKNKSEFILVVTFLNANQPVVDGTYSPKAGFGKPFWCYAAVRVLSGPKGTNASFSVNDGQAVLAGVKTGRISGTFDLFRKNGAAVAAQAAGRFNVPLTVEK